MFTGYLISVAVHYFLKANVQGSFGATSHYIFLFRAVFTPFAGYVDTLSFDSHALALFGAQVCHLTHCLLDLKCELRGVKAATM
jgi:hypothetical protein